MNRVQIEGSILRSWTCGPTDHRAALYVDDNDTRLNVSVRHVNPLPGAGATIAVRGYLTGAALSYTNRDQRSHYMPTIAVEEYDVVSGQGELNGR